MAKASKSIQSELLLLRYKRGDTAAIEELIALWEKPLLYYIRRLVDREEDAWDTLQEVWMKVVRHYETLQASNAFSTWIYRIARNTAIDLFRKEKWFKQSDDEQLDRGNEVSDVDFRNQQLDILHLHQAIQLLSVPHREVITLYFLEDFSIREIAEITHASEGTVKSRLFYAKRALRTALDSKQVAEGDRHA